MKSENIFIGDIRLCTELNKRITFSYGFKTQYITDTKDELYKKNAVLIKIRDRRYVDLDELNKLFDIIKLGVYKKVKGYFRPEIVMKTRASDNHRLFVDESTLIPYKEVREKERISLRKLKKYKNGIIS